MGKGDKKTRRGKITNKSYGVRRPRKKSKSAVAAPAEKKATKAAPKKAAPKPKAPAKPRAAKKKEEAPKDEEE